MEWLLTDHNKFEKKKSHVFSKDYTMAVLTPMQLIDSTLFSFEYLAFCLDFIWPCIQELGMDASCW